MTTTEGQPAASSPEARVAALRARRAEGPRRGTASRRRVALATQIAAAGLGGSTMFGLVAAMALDPPVEAPASPPAAGVPVVIRVHHSAMAAEAPAGGRDLEASGPIALRAQPKVTTVQQAQGPVARTSGSR